MSGPNEKFSKCPETLVKTIADCCIVLFMRSWKTNLAEEVKMELINLVEFGSSLFPHSSSSAQHSGNIFGYIILLGHA